MLKAAVLGLGAEWYHICQGPSEINIAVLILPNGSTQHTTGKKEQNKTRNRKKTL